MRINFSFVEGVSVGMLQRGVELKTRNREMSFRHGSAIAMDQGCDDPMQRGPRAGDAARAEGDLGVERHPLGLSVLKRERRLTDALWEDGDV